MYKIVEIFYSIQGEGYYSGTPSIFIRFHGCALSCPFCDDELHKGAHEKFTAQELLEKIQEFPAKQIVLTGGEPSLYDLNELIEFFQSHGYYICVETSGYDLENIQKADWITYSPKDWDNLESEGFHEYKFIVSTISDITPILALDSDKLIYIQPENHFDTPNVVNVKHCFELVKKHPHIRLSIQMHKYIGVK